MKYYKFLKYLLRLPIFKRLIPSLSIRVLKILKRNRGYFQIKDIKMYLDYLDPIDREIILFQNYEQKEFNHLCELINLNKVRIFVDVGANCGYYSLFVSQLSSIVKVFHMNQIMKLILNLKKHYIKMIIFKKKYNFLILDYQIPNPLNR
jgi:protein-L-isoaspartate O-methyltransferase